MTGYPDLDRLHLTKVLRRFPGEGIPDLEAAVAAEFSRPDSPFRDLRPGARIAVAAGSRGIANLAPVVRAVVRELRSRDARPFVIPAMGSHGGATAEGQREVLAGYGVTEAGVGAPVVSSLDVVELPAAPDGTRVYISRDAWESDGVLLVNRVKPHTDFHGSHESGLVKMAVIGLGKHAQALEIHSHGVAGLRERILPAARVVLGTGKVLGGLGIVENAREETAVLRLVPAEEIVGADRDLLELAKSLQPRLPVDDLDVLLVDEMGKEVSGVGMDSNVIGRIRVRGQEEPARPRISSIAVFDLTEASHGNALGVGLADVITRRLRDRIDLRVTAENVVTSGFLERGKVPLAAETDRAAVEIALRGASVRDLSRARILRIRNTLRLGEFWISDALLRDLAGREGVEITGERAPLLDGSDLARF
mgnify:CR=1 FL=1